ncbi:MAG: hypothetical protein JWQ98_378 [Chlorobi bacterium]|nr:hypothetical protein [Chlorobiota bacterium]
MYTIPVYSVHTAVDGSIPHAELVITGSMPIRRIPITSSQVAARLIADIPECVCSLNLILLVLDASDLPVRVCCASDAAIDADCLMTLFGFVGRSGHRMIIAGERQNGLAAQEYHNERIQKLVEAARAMDVVMLDYILVSSSGEFISLAVERQDPELADADNGYVLA